MDLTLDEATQTIDRYYNHQDRIRAQQGAGSTDGAQAISEAYISQLTEAVAGACDRLARATGPLVGLRPLVVQLPASRIALVALTGVMNCIGWQKPYGDTLRTLGTMLEGEAFAAELTTRDKKMAKQVAEQARSRHFRASKQRGTVAEQRQSWARRKAAGVGFKIAEWSAEDRTLAGSWLVDLVLSTLPEAFVVEGDGEFKRVVMTEDADQYAESIVSAIIMKNPVWLPKAEAPDPWAGLFTQKGRGARLSLVRSSRPETRAAWAAAIKSGQMAPALAGINALQAVPWQINVRVLGVMQACIQHDIRRPDNGNRIKGMPHEKLPAPKWRGTGEPDKAFLLTRRRIRIHNNMVTGERILLQQDMDTAEAMAKLPQFHTPMNMDFRGRVYNITQFNYQREDRVRALFQFRDGAPIGEEGLRWLKIHVATVGSFDRIDKAPFAARAAWTDAYLEKIEEVAACPLKELWWTQAKKPWLFLAAVFELISAMETGPSYVAHLPVAFDGSCSGLQHLCAMTRAPEGHLVNLTPQASPADIYTSVALTVEQAVSRDAAACGDPSDSNAWRRGVASMTLDYGIDRDLVKRNTMTYSYSSKRQGMAAQQQEDTMQPLATEVLEGKRPNHPFGPDWSRGSVAYPGLAARYLADHVYRAIERTVTYPAQAMTFLQRIARTCAHESKPVNWVTPVGIPWSNCYRVPIVERITLWMYDRGVRVRQTTDVCTGDHKEIMKEKSANAVAPNFVHACDAAHLLRVAGNANAAGIRSLATVHDSFGCLPSQATRFREIILAEFVSMYEEHDVLAEVLEAAKCDLTLHNHHRLPDVPEYGTLDIKGVLNAEYAFA